VATIIVFLFTTKVHMSAYHHYDMQV